MLLRLLRVLPLFALLLAGCTPKIGNKCTLSTDCSQLGDRLCDITQPGGYCTVFNCQPDTCPDAICVAFDPQLDPACGAATDGRWPRFERSYCLAPCDSDSDCRDQYQCVDLHSPDNQDARRAQVVDLGLGGFGYKVCMATVCGDGIKNGVETDVDCGGTSCSPCGNGLHCSSGSDCTSGNCYLGSCVGLNCFNGQKDGAETDVDCGGPDCARCTGGKPCQYATDCTSNVCDSASLTCQAGDCSNSKKDGAETDVDCGGPGCAKCAIGKGCAADADCGSAICGSDLHCNAPPSPPVCSVPDAGFDGSAPWTPYTPPDGG